MTDESIEVSPFDFVSPGSADKDFSPYVHDANEPEEAELPKDELLAPASSSPTMSGESAPPAGELPPPTDSSPPVPESTPTPAESLPNPHLATPPIPSSPSVAKTTPQAS